MSVLRIYVNRKHDSCSPIQEDLERVVKYDEKGNEIISYLPVDYPALVKSNGIAEMWSLNNLLKAGVNPDFPVRTGLNSRIEGVNEIEKAAAAADAILSESKDAE